MRIIYLGKEVWTLHGFEFTSGDRYYKAAAKEWKPEQFLEELKSEAFQKKIVIAFTSNKFQEDAVVGLKAAGFEKIVTFYSSHNEDDQTVTLWLKINESAVATDINEIIGDFPYNCSVRMCENGARCCFLIKQNDDDLLINFKQVKGMPVWFKIEAGQITDRHENK